jgi:iron complex outermembrane recepter protein
VYKLQTKSNFRSWLLAGAAVALATGAANAQEQTVETVVVTGSLIQRSAGDMPTPTVVLSSEAIQKTGMPNLSGVLAQLPQIQNSSGAGDLTPVNSNFLTSGFGVWNVDLRNLGSSRTLVLVNGRRQVTGSPTGSSVDLNTVPTSLVDHVDVITGGASAAYGSDAVAGVVNIVLKKDFEGVAVNYQNGISSRGDGSETYGTVTLGGNFANDRGNITLSVSYDHTGAVMSKDRDITSTDTTWVPGLIQYTGTHVGPFERAALGYAAAYSSYGVGGRFRLASAPNYAGQIVGGGSSYNPDGSVFNTALNGYDRNPQRYIQVPVSRKVIAETGHYDLTNWLTFFLETTYALTTSSQQMEPYPGTSEDGLSAPVSAGGTGVLIPRNNPFIPTSAPAGATSLATRLANTPSSPGLFYYRRFLDLGPRTGSVDRNLAKVTFGFDGTLPIKDWKWTAYYEWGRTEESQFSGGYYDKIKMQNALIARTPTAGEVAPAGGGGFVCADPVAQAAGCVPINLFGAGSITPQAASYVGSLVTLQDHQTEQVANFEASGSLFDMPAGAVKLALGGEYRREEAQFEPDAASQAGTVAGNKVPATVGAFQVTEVFAEGMIPLLKDKAFAKYLEIDGAVRWAHYSTAGDATSWNYRAVWQPTDDLKFRATESSATRAPNIAELFSPAAQTFPGIGTTADLCRNPAAGAPMVAGNCAANFALLGPYVPGERTYPSYSQTIGQAAAQGVGGYSAGNPNLKPETASTFTAGIVYTPSWLHSFQATVDFYDIRVKNYIGGLSGSSTIDACYQSTQPFASNFWCQQILRQHDSVLGPIIKQINFPTVNLGSIKTNGIDTEIGYAFDMAELDPGLEKAGAWSFLLDVNYINAFSTDPGQEGVAAIPSGGTVGTPHFRGKLKTTYSLDPVTVTLSSRYIGGAIVDRTLLDPVYNADQLITGYAGANSRIGNKVNSTWYFDLNVSYALSEKTEIYAGANNLFDNRPPEIYPGAGYDDTGTGTAADVYDPIGMYLYAGVNFKM